MAERGIYERYGSGYAGKPDVRERISTTGPPSVSDADLLAAILGSGVRGKNVLALADEILDRVDMANHAPGVEAFLAISGIGQARACTLAAAFELGKRLYGTSGEKIRGPEDAWRILRHWADRKQERFIACTLNGAHDLIGSRVVTVGLVNRTLIHPREIFAEAIADRACALIVAHNHPSGRLEASPEDVDVTMRMKKAGDLMGIPLLDHIIFSDRAFLSLVEAGVIPPDPEG